MTSPLGGSEDRRLSGVLRRAVGSPPRSSVGGPPADGAGVTGPACSGADQDGRRGLTHRVSGYRLLNTETEPLASNSARSTSQGSPRLC